MNLVEIGLKLIVDQAAQFQKTMGDATNSTQRFGQAGQKAEIDFKKLFETLVMGNVASQILMRAIDGIVQKLDQAINGSVEAAARFEQLTFVARLMGQRQGYTAEQIDELIQKLRDYRITAEAAADTVIQFAKYELDLAKAQDLVKVAQDAAVVSGMDTSEAYQRILWGIQTYNSETLRTVGINIRSDTAFQNYAKTLGTTAAALTENQRQAAILNAVIEEGSKIAGARAAADQSATTVGKSLVRVWNDLTIALGMPFVEAYRQALLAETAFVKGLAAAVEEGGKLHWILEGLGGVAQYFAEGLAAGAPGATNSFIDMLNNIAQSAVNYGEQALSWGVNLVANFASGIIEGAAWALSTAMDAIASFLSMLMPGSPPPIAPDIDKWGAGTFTEWLKGFSEADFSTLTSLESVISSALNAMGKDTMETATGTRDIMGSLIRGIASGDMGGALGQIRGSLGQYGVEVALLAEKQMALAKATEAVKAAEEKLKNFREQEQKANDKLLQTINEYNKLAAEGASPEVLAAKRKEYEEAKKAQQAAKAGRIEAEKEYTAKAEGLDKLQEDAKKQENVVKQLIDLTKDLSKLAGAKGGAGGGVKLPSVDKLDIGAATKKMEGLSEGLRKKLDKIFEPLGKVSEAWQNAFGENGTVTKSWETFSESVTNFYDLYIKPVFDKISQDLGKVFPPEFINNAGKVLGVLLVLLAAAKIISIIGTIIKGAALLITGPAGIIAIIIGLIALIVTNWDTIGPWLATTWENIKAAFVRAWTVIKETFTEIWDKVKAKAEEIWGAIKAKAEATWADIKQKWETAKATIESKWNEFKTTVETTVNTLKTNVETAWTTFTNKISETWNTIKTTVETAWETFRTTVETTVNTLKTNIEATWKTFTEGIKTKWDEISGTLSTAWETFKSSISSVFQTISDTVSGIWNGFLDGIKGAWDTAVGWINEAIRKIREFLGLKDEAAANQSGTSAGTGYATKAKKAINPHARGGGFTIPAGFENEGWNLGGGQTASSGEAVLIFPKRIAQALIHPAASPDSMLRSFLGRQAAQTNQDIRNYNLTLQTQMQPATVSQSFEVMRILGG